MCQHSIILINFLFYLYLNYAQCRENFKIYTLNNKNITYKQIAIMSVAMY